MIRIVTMITVGVIGGVLACAGLFGAVLFGGNAAAGCPTITAPTGAVTPGPSGATDVGALGPLGPIGRWDSEQVGNAATIITVGIQLGVPPRGWVIAVATAMQESSLRNLAGGDQDSIGLFQQRPSQGWGSPQQLRDPGYAATRFYQKLLTIPGWTAMALTDAAQAVQRSAHPDAYAKWEPDATTVVAALTGLTGITDPSLLTGCAGDGGDGMTGEGLSLPADYTLPADTPTTVVTAIVWALAQLGTPYHFGGDCTDPHSGVAAHQCDCSSLVQQAYAHAGITIPRTTADQQHTGTPVTDPDQLRPGDLVFIPGADGTPSDPGHVGLYLGQGLILQAPHTGDHIKITSLAAWRPDLAKIRRVVP